MAMTTAIAIYFLIWWVVLFAVLPWGVRAQGEESPAGTDPGAPRVPHLKAKLLWTTALSAAIFAACAYAYVTRLVTLDGVASWLGTPF
jgi:predicted secreted protein